MHFSIALGRIIVSHRAGGSVLTHQELEVWSREIVAAVLKQQRIEDSKIELKADWPEADRAASQLAGHANAARGMPILWLIGVDEKAKRISNADPVELANWSKSIAQFFDGDAPRMVLDANIRIDSDTVVALYFETHQGALFVVKNPRGGYPQFVVPWREGTSKRAARRDELLRILVPIRRLSALTDELNFNLAVANTTKTIASMGTLFREDEFHQTLKDGVLSTLPDEKRQSIINAYLSISRANHLVTTALASSNWNVRHYQLNDAWQAVRDCRQLIQKACEALMPL
jgi:hypothetical protein